MTVAVQRWLPQTLFGRLLSSLLLAIGVTMMVMLVLVFQDRAVLSMRVGGVGDSSHRIEALTHMVENVSPSGRAAYVQSLSEDTTFRAAPSGRQERAPNRREFAAIERAFVTELHERMGSAYRVQLRRPADLPPRGLIRVVSARPGERIQVLDIMVWTPVRDSLLFRVASPQAEPTVPWTLFAELGVLTFVLIVVLFVVTRSITRPLSNLARAADAAGRSVRAPSLPEEGVQEIREATRAFNSMQERLLRYLDSRTRVLAAMSHDLRTPLTRMRLRVESVTDERLRAKFVSDLEETEDLVHGALALFGGVSDDEPLEPVDVNVMAASLVAGYADLGATIPVEGIVSAPIDAKPSALRRCLTNLIDNALKFGTRAAITVRNDGREVVITVHDDGPGIPDELLEQVFEPFFRVDESRNRDTGDAGLGLSIARDVAQSHGGTLVLRNRTEGGLVAELRLPN